MDLIKQAPKKIIGAFEFRGGVGHQEQCQYNVDELLGNLEIKFTGKIYTSKQFFERLERKIFKTNKKMTTSSFPSQTFRTSQNQFSSENEPRNLDSWNICEEVQRITLKPKYHEMDLKPDLIFKYRVTMLDREWT